MIHIATVHWKDDRWIDIQLRAFSTCINAEYKTYAFLNDIDGHHSVKFTYSSDEAIEKHAIKLNILADMIHFNSSSEEDIIIFIDGDAFPIGNIVEFANQKLKHYPLIAVQRRENDGDVQPHPCFCITTVGFWKKIKGDWKAGYTWMNEAGKQVTDVGGNLLGLLNEHNVEWHPMLRSNKVNLHPIWFGIYEDMVYHHGAGFREIPLSRYEHSRRFEHEGGNLLFKSIKRLPRRSVLRKLHRYVDNKTVKHLGDANREMGDRIYKSILNDPLFFKEYI